MSGSAFRVARDTGGTCSDASSLHAAIKFGTSDGLGAEFVNKVGIAATLWPLANVAVLTRGIPSEARVPSAFNTKLASAEQTRKKLSVAERGGPERAAHRVREPTG